MPKKATKKATKGVTKKATKRKSTKLSKASQLEVMLQARDYLSDSKCKGEFLIMGDITNTVPGFVPSGSLAIDWIINDKGFPQSRIWDITGAPGTGKSTIADHVLVEVQKMGGHAWLWDSECARDATYQNRMGLVRSKAGQIKCRTMESGFDAMIKLIEWHNVHDPDTPGVIIWDTPAATPTEAELNEDKKNEAFGPAKLIKGNLRKLVMALDDGRWMLGIVNQLYSGAKNGKAYQAAYGGEAIPYFANIRLACSHGGYFYKDAKSKDLGSQPLGQFAWVKCTKSRVGNPLKSKRVCIHLGEGINNQFEVFQVLAAKDKCIKTAGGGWCSFNADNYPELAEKCPGKFQATVNPDKRVAGHVKFDEFVREVPGLWEDLLKVYHQIMGGV